MIKQTSKVTRDSKKEVHNLVTKHMQVQVLKHMIVMQCNDRKTLFQIYLFVFQVQLMFYSCIVWFLYWQDMNDPSNFLNGTINGCPNTTLDNPPYLPFVDGQTLYHHTLCMSAKHYNGQAHYDVHNIYGLAEALVTSL